MINFISFVLYFQLCYYLPKECFGVNATDKFEMQMYTAHKYIIFKECSIDSKY